MMIEIKRSTAPQLSKGFRLSQGVLAAEQAYLVHSGDGTWPIGESVTAISLEELIRRLSAE